jgi:non-specific serine/threonine protein kinase
VKKVFATTRLLTLLGVGGLGKTRLSLQVGADVMDDYPDGVWFIELAPLPDPRLVPQAVASALGVVEESGRPVQEALVKHVRDRKLLLILDNCEHLALAAAELAKALLQAGPQVKVLATSRESLRLSGETSFSVPPLAVPSKHRPMNVAALLQIESVRLFADRALAAKPTFAVTEKNVQAVAAICHTLDGIPLALELAAARVRALPVEAIAERLSDRFRLLTGGDKTSLPRQQTLRACIDWSFDLLSVTEQSMLRRLAVFAGGWTLEAAEKVGADPIVDVYEVVDLLTHLVEKSLVQLEADGDRYRLLETVRQYAKERLEEAGEKAQTRTRHLAHFLSFAEEAMPHLMGVEQADWLARLDVERENLLVAHAWCDRAQDGAELGLRLLNAVRAYWISRGLGVLGLRVSSEALGRAGAAGRHLLRCQALDATAYLAYFMSRFDEAQRFGEECLAIAREIENKDRVVAALTLLGAVALGKDDRAAAKTRLEESLALARELDDSFRLETALTGLAEVFRIEGDLDAAEPLYEESLALNRREGVGSNIAVNLLNIAMVAIGRGMGERARAMLVEAFEIAERIGWQTTGRDALDVAAGLAAFEGEWLRAARLYGAAGELLTQTGMGRQGADEAFLKPLMAKARAKLGDVAFAEADAAGRGLTYEEATAETRAWLANRS